MRVRKRNPERGCTLIVAMLVFSSMSILAGLTVVSQQSSMATTRAERFNATALYAAESGAAAAMDYLRAHANPNFDGYVSPNNVNPVSPAAILGNNIQPLSAGNPFSNDMRAWYSVMILNNRSDTGYSSGHDNDHTVIIYVTGYGPMGAVATLEWEVVSDPLGAPDKPFTLVGWRQIL